VDPGNGHYPGRSATPPTLGGGTFLANQAAR